MTLLAGPDQVTASRAARLRSPVLAIAGVAAATVALHLRDPHVTHSWGACPLYAFTGIYCPGCGGLRAVNDLTNGHVGAAASSNLLFIVLIPAIVLLAGRWVLAAWQGREVTVVPPFSRPVQLAGLTVVVAFTLARNWPGSWLAP